MLSLLTGCTKQQDYIDKHTFDTMVIESYQLDKEPIEDTSIITLEEAKEVLEKLCESTVITSIQGPYLTKQEAKDLIDLSLHLFLDQIQEGCNSIEYKDIEDLSKNARLIDENHLESSSILEIGQIVIVNQNAYKIIDRDDHIYTITRPEVEEICNDISLQEPIHIQQDQIQVEEGVKLSSTIPTKSNVNFTFEVNFSKDQLELSSDFGKLLGMEASIKIGKESKIIHTSEFERLSIIPSRTDFEKIIAENRNIPLEIKDRKFKKGYELTGSISLSNLVLQPCVEMHQGKLESLSFNLSYECTSKLKYKGVISEDLKLATFVIPIGSTGATLHVGLYLNIAANGEVELSLKNASHTKVSYSNDLLKKVCTKSTTLTTNGAIKLLLGPKFDMVLQIYGITISNFDLLLQAELKNEASYKLKQETDDTKIYHQVIFDYHSDLYGPIVTLKLGTRKSLANRLGIVFDGKLFNENNSLHYPIYKSQFVIFEMEEDREKGILEKERLDLKTYVYQLKLNEKIPIEFSYVPSDIHVEDLNYEIADGNIATVQGGQIVGLKVGSTSLKIYDQDHQYQIECSIHVGMEMMEDFIGL